MRLREALPALTTRKADRVIEIPVSLWAETVDGRPDVAVKMGLRLVSEQDEREATVEGDEREHELESATDDERTRAYNSGVMARLVGAGACLALDATQPFFGSYLEAERRLTSAGIRFVFDQLQILSVAAQVSVREAGDEEFSHLIAIWERGEALDRMPVHEARKIRRVIEWVRQTLATVEEQAEARELAGVG